MQLQPKVPFSYRMIGEDMAVLRKALAQTLARVPGAPDPASQRRILNLACGRADETAILADIFGQGASELEIVGADIRAAEIEEASRRWNTHPGQAIQTRFHVDDGARLLEGMSGGDRFDLAFLRHQNFWNDPELWGRMFDGALNQLEDDGLFVITSYFDVEHRQACQALEDLGAVKVAEFRNPLSRALTDAPGKSVDRHIAVFRRTRPL